MDKQLQPLKEYEKIRRIWDDTTNRWWFAVVDVVHVLSDATDPHRYWADMKRRDESGQLLAICEKFPLESRKNNRTYQTECADQPGILRIIQSIPSPKAEPFKQWLAMTGSRRLDEIQADPLEAEKEKYRLAGYDENWINALIGSITTRNQLTDEWQNRGVQGREYGILTNEIHKGAFGNLSVQEHKELKDVKKGNLRDHMTPLELAFTILGEASTIEEINDMDAQGFAENKQAAQKGGENAGIARKSFEQASGHAVISNRSYLESRRELQAGDASDNKDRGSS